jgi:hypothetical protein
MPSIAELCASDWGRQGAVVVKEDFVKLPWIVVFKNSSKHSTLIEIVKMLIT